ncbi:GIY-YIG nuclease family protein [Urbifossiella limnaea]|uniref:GIY-YIG nuclease family protein n=1 Tax=Urbifossiella limnaea TaxID=2528023 RepID=A0A517XW54_9BACT|nr:GIY-YIG nuclease family protein [Urbifossiella limnaea]QDU21738.1 hypothetical protein ETAA1_37110 [Urbifossiella limnaea]
MTPEPTPPNADLYRAGQQYIADRARLSAGRKQTATWVTVAAECGVDRKAVVTAANFTSAVDRIAANCGRGARRLLLSDHPRLPARVLMKIGRTHAERQRFALAQARAGRNPLGKPPAGVDPPFDTHGYTEVASRLARNAGLLDHVADGLLATRPRAWPAAGRTDGVLHDVRTIRAHWRRIDALMKRAGGRLADERGHQPWKPRGRPAAYAPTTTRAKVASVRGIAEKNARELPRVVRETPPTRAEADAVREAARVLRRAAERLAAVVRSRGHDPLTGPPAVPGTYVAFCRLPEAATAVRIGKLGTFDFPAGYYAYAGSAFGPGGVRKRTHRHLTTVTPRMWNLDHLKPLGTPVAVWWTLDRVKVEFAWAAILAALPGASYPARGFGAADNPKAKAHLIRFDRMPSVTAFRRRVAAALTGHAPIHEKTVAGWTGAGWPG